ncbi:MAG: OmpA family protein [Caulobacteraceae bacterium]
MLLGAIGLSGCATKKFVREQVAVVDTNLQTTQSQVDAEKAKLQAHEAQLATLDKTSREALERAMAAGKLAEGKFLFSVVVQDDGVKFAHNKYGLSPEAQARLNELIQRLKAENKNVFMEIQGHTDSTGEKAYNEHLGEERAEEVRKFLSLQGVALNRIATISYGEDVPAAPNTTRDGRAKNRRVVIVVLA